MHIEWQICQFDAWDEVVTFWHTIWEAPRTKDGDGVQEGQNSFQNRCPLLIAFYEIEPKGDGSICSLS